MALSRRELKTKVTITNLGDDPEGDTDEYGNLIDVEETWTEYAKITPASSTEILQPNRDTRTTQFQCILIPETRVTGISTIAWTDTFGFERTARVDGEPIYHEGARGPSHVSVNLTEFVA